MSEQVSEQGSEPAREQVSVVVEVDGQKKRVSIDKEFVDAVQAATCGAIILLSDDGDLQVEEQLGESPDGVLEIEGGDPTALEVLIFEGG